jgi:hypothetical protein
VLHASAGYARKAFVLLQVFPLRTIAAGEEVTVAYVPRASNDELMRDYGFVVHANPYDYLSLPASQQACTSMQAWSVST